MLIFGRDLIVSWYSDEAAGKQNSSWIVACALWASASLKGKCGEHRADAQH